MKSVKIKRSGDSVKRDENGIISLSPSKSWLSFGLDNRGILNYSFDADIHIPTGTIGIVFPANDIWKYSLAYSGPFVLTAGNIEDFSVSFKADTNVAPRVFEKGEVAVNVIFLSLGEGLTPVEFEIKEVKEDNAPDSNADLEKTADSEASDARSVIGNPETVNKAIKEKIQKEKASGTKAEDMMPFLEQ